MNFYIDIANRKQKMHTNMPLQNATQLPISSEAEAEAADKELYSPCPLPVPSHPPLSSAQKPATPVLPRPPSAPSLAQLWTARSVPCRCCC